MGEQSGSGWTYAAECCSKSGPGDMLESSFAGPIAQLLEQQTHKPVGPSFKSPGVNHFYNSSHLVSTVMISELRIEHSLFAPVPYVATPVGSGKKGEPFERISSRKSGIAFYWSGELQSTPPF